ncbi:MAG: hypothetical protein ACK2U9_13955 [Anaerolineae bacterium]
MRVNSLRSLYCAGVCLGLLSLPVLAQSPNGVVVGPVPAVPAAAATPVPLMHPLALVTLGLVLAVLAARLLYRSSRARRLSGLAILGAGLVISATGVDRVLAVVNPPIAIEGDGCDQDTEYFYDAIGNGAFIGLQNNCPNPVVIKSFVNRQCPENAPLQTDAAYVDCRAGTQLGASGSENSSCEALPYCLE